MIRAKGSVVPRWGSSKEGKTAVEPRFPPPKRDEHLLKWFFRNLPSSFPRQLLEPVVYQEPRLLVILLVDPLSPFTKGKVSRPGKEEERKRRSFDLTSIYPLPSLLQLDGVLLDLEVLVGIVVVGYEVVDSSKSLGEGWVGVVVGRVAEEERRQGRREVRSRRRLIDLPLEYVCHPRSIQNWHPTSFPLHSTTKPKRGVEGRNEIVEIGSSISSSFLPPRLPTSSLPHLGTAPPSFDSFSLSLDNKANSRSPETNSPR